MIIFGQMKTIHFSHSEKSHEGRVEGAGLRHSIGSAFTQSLSYVTYNVYHVLELPATQGSCSTLGHQLKFFNSAHAPALNLGC